MRIWLAILSLVLLAGAACGSDAVDAPTPTAGPTATATAEPTPSPTVAPATSTPEPKPSPTSEPTAVPLGDSGLSEQDFVALLTTDDLVGLGDATIGTEIMNFRALAEGVDPAQVEHIESWYGLSINGSEAGSQASLAVMDFDTESAAKAHYDLVSNEAPGLVATDPLVGLASVGVEINASGIGSIFTAVQGDKVILMYTNLAGAQDPLASLKEITGLAAIVASRLG